MLNNIQNIKAIIVWYNRKSQIEITDKKNNLNITYHFQFHFYHEDQQMPETFLNIKGKFHNKIDYNHSLEIIQIGTYLLTHCVNEIQTWYYPIEVSVFNSLK